MDLVVMAAGMGSRFGGLKQCEPIDDDNNFILDYSIYDAVRAGFDRVVLIIKEENYEYFKQTVGKRLEIIVPVVYVFQSVNDVPAGFKVPENRVKPWGTAHAIYCCKDVIADKFAIINADDFYGKQSYQIMADLLRNNHDENTCLSAGFHVKNTLSDKGAVKRGIYVIENGKVVRLIESEVENRGNKTFATPMGQNDWHEIDGDALVSMNLFGFSSKIMDKLGEKCNEFFKQPADKLEKAEILLVDVLNDLICENNINLIIQETPSKWYGITYKDDLGQFKQAIKNMKADGSYPKHIYAK